MPGRGARPGGVRAEGAAGRFPFSTRRVRMADNESCSMGLAQLSAPGTTVLVSRCDRAAGSGFHRSFWFRPGKLSAPPRRRTLRARGLAILWAGRLASNSWPHPGRGLPPPASETREGALSAFSPVPASTHRLRSEWHGSDTVSTRGQGFLDLNQEAGTSCPATTKPPTRRPAPIRSPTRRRKRRTSPTPPRRRSPQPSSPAPDE